MNPARIDAEENQGFADPQRPAFTQGAVVFLRAAFIAMTVDQHGEVGVGTEMGGDEFDFGELRFADVGDAEFEVDRVRSEDGAVQKETFERWMLVQFGVGAGFSRDGVWGGRECGTRRGCRILF